MREMHLFSGVGGGILGGMLLGHTCVCAVEIEPYCRKVLLQRQRDGILPRFPIWDDVRTFDGRPWRGLVDVVAGGFPCQDICAVNSKAVGISGKRSGLWSEFARTVCEVDPNFVLVENSPVLTCRGLGVVLGDLARLGYNARWGVLGARHCGAPCKRDRIWIMGAKPDAQRWPRVLSRNTGVIEGPRGWWPNDPLDSSGAAIKWMEDRHSQPALLGGSDGLANIVDELGAIGNGQVPAVVRLAWQTLI